MGADDDHLRTRRCGWRLDCHVDVAHGLAVGNEFLPADREAIGLQSGLDVTRDLLQLVVVRDIVLAGRNDLDVSPERNREHAFCLGERRQGAAMRCAGHARQVA